MGSAMALGRVERLQIMLTEDELAALDDWRFARRMPSRAAAIREILRRGLVAEGFVLADKGVKSKDFGILVKQKVKPARRDQGG
jgi:metal-responsive CopG/Arc/MetJ family transcriptional regulator